MTSLAPSSFSSANISVQHHQAAAFTEAAPWREILAVEPDSAVLSAKALLLTKANYCVTQATGLGDLFSVRNTKAFALAILSDRLGQRLLGTVAATVRRQWPRTRILILGQVPMGWRITSTTSTFVAHPISNSYYTRHAFRVESETVRFLNGYTPASLEAYVVEWAMPATERILPPKNVFPTMAFLETYSELLSRYGMDILSGPRSSAARGPIVRTCVT
jgi:hypothetical protein